MFKNYLKIALRNLVKHKIYSVINISGLALGLACSILILLWVWDELSYDSFFKDANQIYRVNWDYKWNESEGIGPGTPPPLAAALVNEIPGIRSVVRIYSTANMTVRHGQKFFNENKILGVDSSFFEIFNYRFISGNADNALTEPNSVVLTENTAHKYFGDEDALDKIIRIGEEKNILGKPYHNLFKVTGIIQNPPANSHLQFDFLTSISSHPEVAYFDWSWVWMQVTTYLKLDNGISSQVVQSEIPAIVKKYAPSAFSRIGFSFDELIKNGGRWNFILQPMPEIYLKSGETGNRLGPVGNITYVYIFSIIAVFILSLACINFMNLATAYSTNRAKEIGIRKVLGSRKKILVIQFLVESVGFSFLSLLVAMFIVEVMLPLFNNLAGKSLQFDIFNSPILLLWLLLLTLIVGLTAGIYPGFYLSSFKTTQVLKGKLNAGSNNIKLRNVLVVLQFTVTIGLIVCTLIVQNQMDFLRNSDLGFNKEGLVVISNENHRLGDQAEAFKEALKSDSHTINASISSGIPPNYGFEDSYKAKDKEGEQMDLQLDSYMVDEDFIPTLGIKVIQGRNFSRDFSTDSAGVLLNESAVKLFGWKNPIGKILTYPGGDYKNYKVIGVLKDFNFLTLHEPITPFALFNTKSKSYDIAASYIVVRIPHAHTEGSIKFLKSEWETFAPNIPFEYKFLDESFEQSYLSDQRLGKIFFIFSFLTIFIACIGLFGLVSFSSKQRTKEIGVRKVLGASVSSIVGLLIKNFLVLVLTANIIACPLVYYFMNKWLQGFAYRININWWMFILAGGLALLIALVTISFQAIKAATANPVESLRYE